MKKVLCLLLAVMLLLSLVGCTSAPDQTTEAPQEKEEITSLHFNTCLTSDPTSMDVSRISDVYSSTLVKNVMESLVRMGESNGRYKILPGDALTWDVNYDGTVWTFHLGNNTWSDGRPVTAQDYAYSLRRSADPTTECPNEYFLRPIAGYEAVRSGSSPYCLGVKALDDKTLQITLAYPVPSFLEMVCDTVYYPQRRDYVEQYGELYGTAPEYTVFNGAYTLESWERGVSLELKKREDYWNAESVQIETVSVAILSDFVDACVSFAEGRLDYVTTSDGEWVEKLSGNPDNTFVRIPSSKVNFCLFNLRDPLFANPDIRRAFTLAIDRSALNQTIYGGSAEPATGWVTSAMAVGFNDYRTYAGDMIAAMQTEAEQEGLTASDYLLRGMAELGLGDAPAALDITLSLAGSDDWFRTFAAYLQQTCRDALGIELKVIYQDWNGFYSQITEGSFQLGYMSWEAYYNDPSDVLSLFLSDNETLNAGFVNTQYDTLVQKAQWEMDETVRLELYRQAEEILLLEQCAVCPLLFPSTNSFYKSHIQGYPTLAFSSGCWQFLRISEEAE